MSADIELRIDHSDASGPWVAIYTVPDLWYDTACSGCQFSGMHGGANGSPFARESALTPSAALAAVQRRVGEWYMVQRAWEDRFK